MCKSVTNKPCYMHSVTCLYRSTWKVEAELGLKASLCRMRLCLQTTTKQNLRLLDESVGKGAC